MHLVQGSSDAYLPRETDFIASVGFSGFWMKSVSYKSNRLLLFWR